MDENLPGDFDDEREDWAQPFEHERNEYVNANAKNYIKSSTSTQGLGVNKGARALAHDRTIIHFDVDCFYAQVEMLRNPELKLKPLGIQQKNIVVTCNYIARKFGVTKLMYITDAKKKCPQLVLVSGEDLTNYRQVSYQISDFIKKYTPHVERLGFDENFVDVSELVSWRQTDGSFTSEFTGHEYQKQEGQVSSKCDCGCEQRIQIGSQIAADIREALQKELGITCCAGIAHNKVLAKLVAGTHKPNQQTSLLPHLAQHLVVSLPSALSIPGIGHKMHKRIQALGIASIKDLQTVNPLVLAKEFGPQTANVISQLCFGVDPSPVVAFSPPQTFSDEDSFKCCNNYQDAEQRIKDLTMSLMKRIVEDGRTPQTVRLSIRRVGHHSNSRESRQTPVPGNVFTQFHATGTMEAAERRMLPIVMGLFKKLVEPSKAFHLTLINVCFAKLVKQDSSSGLSQFFSKHSSTSQSCDQEMMVDCYGNVDCEVGESGFDESDPNTYDSNLLYYRSDENEKNVIMREKSAIDVVKKPAATATSSKKQSVSVMSFFSKRMNAEEVLPDVSVKANDKINATKNIDKKQDNPLNIVKSPNSSFPLHARCTPDFTCTSQHLSLSTEARTATSPRTNSESVSTDEPAGCAVSNSVAEKLEQSLVDILPKEFDAGVIMELPMTMQKEILGHYGILVEELPEGRHFTLMSNSVVTRSQVCKADFPVTRKRPLFSPKKSTPQCLLNSKNQKRMRNRQCVVSDKSPAKGDDIHITQNTLEESTCITMNQSVSMHVEMQTQEPYSPQQNISMSNCSDQCTDICTESHDVEDNNIGNKTPLREAERSAPQNISTCTLPETDKAACVTNNFDTLEPHHTRIHGTVETTKNSVGGKPQPSETPLEISTSVLDVDQNMNRQHQSKYNQDLTRKSPQKLVFGSPQNVKPSNHGKVTEKVSLSESILKKLPKDISPEVFSQLPGDIRGEIMAHILMGTPVTAAVGVSSSVSINSNKIKKSKPATFSKRQATNTSSSSSSQKSLFSYFIRKDK